MTWTCPTCDRDYPDSIIGVPRGLPASEKQGCVVCWVSPAGEGGYVHPGEAEE